MSNQCLNGQCLSVKQVAEELAVSTDYVRRLIAYKHLEAVNISYAKRRPTWRIEREALEAFKLRGRSKPPTPTMKRKVGLSLKEYLANEPTKPR